MNILFVSLGGDTPNAAPPLGMLYLASIAKAKGCNVRFHDASFSNNDPLEFEKYLKGLKEGDEFIPDICGFTLFTINLLDSYDFAEIVCRYFPQCKIMVGGPHATALPERTMEECPRIHCLAYGEGEVTFSEIIDVLNGERSLDTVDGIYYRNENGIAFTKPRAYIDDLDSIPFPAFELLPKDYPYKNYDGLNLGNTGAPIITSRGCPYQCTFCFKDIFGTRFRRRSPGNVVAELERLVTQFNINNIFFEDDFFAVNKTWLEELYKEMRDRGIHIPWRCQGRVNTLAKEDYLKMRENGCYHITFGVESGNDAVLLDIKKKITIKQTIETFDEVRNTGLVVMGNFIFGHRHDTMDTLYDTLHHAERLNPDTVSFLCLAPIPGSETYSYLPEQMKYAWTKHGAYTGNAGTLPISICGVSAKDLKDFKDMATIHYYVRPRYVWENILAPRNFGKPLQGMKATMFLMYAFLYFEGKLGQYAPFRLAFKGIRKLHGRVRQAHSPAEV